MTKQEEIREEIKSIVLGAMSHHSGIGAHFPDTILAYLHSQGVVIKVDRELPDYPGDDAFDKLLKSDIYLNAQDDMMKAKWEAVESLLEVNHEVV